MTSVGQPIIRRPGDDDIYDDGDYRRGGKRKNPLLVRSQVGKVKATTYDLPGSDFAFGKKDQFDEEGVREVVHSWSEHKTAAEPLPGRDFVRLNRSAAATGCTTAKSVADYRRTNDIRLNGSLTTTSRGASLIMEPSLDGTTFGRPSKPSTPIGNVLCNVYQRTWIQDQREQARKEAARANTRSVQRSSRPANSASHTRASLGHKKVEASAAPTPFKLQQFADVPSRVRLPKGARVIPQVNSSARLIGASHSTASSSSLPPVAPSYPINGNDAPEVYTQEQLQHVA